MSLSFSPQVRGIVCMVGAGFCLTAQDAIIKWMTNTYPVGEIMAVRGAIALVFTGFLMRWYGGWSVLRVTSWWLQVLRALCVVGTTATFITAIRYLPLATAITVSFAGPLMITAMAPRFLGEHVGWRRWTAVTVGFIGVIVVFRPGSGEVNPALLFPLATAVLVAVRDVSTRALTVRDHSAGILFYAMLAVTLGGLMTWPFGWVALDMDDLYLFLITGFMVCIAQFLMIVAFRYAEATVLAPFKYFSIIWGSVIGYLVWRDIPDSWTISGGILIVLSGLYILHRERA